MHSAIYRLQKNSNEITIVGDLDVELRVILERMLDMPNETLIQYNGEWYFGALERAGYLRLVTHRNVGGEMIARSCYLSSCQAWPLS